MQFKTTLKYENRQTKYKYVSDKYSSILKGKVLDVGSDECYLKQCLPKDVEYLGVGFGNVDQYLDLEKDTWPFKDQEFDCVLCLDVLEHIENIHFITDRLCQGSKKYVIIALPNPWSNFWEVLRSGRSTEERPLKFYGLPKEREEDRHKWFYSIKEAQEFLQYIAQKNHMKILQYDYEYTSRPCGFARRLIRKIIFKFLFKKFDECNFDVSKVWCVLEKQ